jgi:hypothetical protein
VVRSSVSEASAPCADFVHKKRSRCIVQAQYLAASSDLKTGYGRGRYLQAAHACARRGARKPRHQELFMKTKKMALIGALALAFSTTAFAQAASDAHATTMKKQKGTTLHQQNKAHKLKGASAAAAASSLGTNDKGQPQ